MKYDLLDLYIKWKRHRGLVVAPGIFLRMFFKKYKLYNLIKREIHILTTTIINNNKKHANT